MNKWQEETTSKQHNRKRGGNKKGHYLGAWTYFVIASLFIPEYILDHG